MQLLLVTCEIENTWNKIKLEIPFIPTYNNSQVKMLKTQAWVRGGKMEQPQVISKAWVFCGLKWPVPKSVFLFRLGNWSPLAPEKTQTWEMVDPFSNPEHRSRFLTSFRCDCSSLPWNTWENTINSIVLTVLQVPLPTFNTINLNKPGFSTTWQPSSLNRFMAAS